MAPGWHEQNHYEDIVLKIEQENALATYDETIALGVSSECARVSNLPHQ